MASPGSQVPPPILYKMMGVWSTLTGSTDTEYLCHLPVDISGILGFFANLLAVCLFIKVRKVTFDIRQNFSLNIFSSWELPSTVFLSISPPQSLSSQSSEILSLPTIHSIKVKPDLQAWQSPLNNVPGWTFSTAACQANAFGMTFLGWTSLL